MTQVNELSAKMLREAASFFLKISQDNPAAQTDMANNADTYYKMAELIEKDPQGATEHLTHAEMARLLGDAAIFSDPSVRLTRQLRSKLTTMPMCLMSSPPCCVRTCESGGLPPQQNLIKMKLPDGGVRHLPKQPAGAAVK